MLTFCNLFITCLEHEREDVRNWAVHKKHDVIAAGLNKFCSLMSRITWDQVRKHTNAVEQAANKSYAYGKRQDLLPAIIAFVTRS
jgi:hypothetical protein